jgi:hypothetical protein
MHFEKAQLESSTATCTAHLHAWSKHCKIASPELPKCSHSRTIKTPFNDVRALWPVTLPLLASRSECAFLFDVLLLIRVECGALCPNPSTRQKLRNDVQPAVRGKICLGVNGKEEEIKNKKVIEDAERHLKSEEKSRKKHKAIQALQSKRLAASTREWPAGSRWPG